MKTKYKLSIFPSLDSHSDMVAWFESDTPFNNFSVGDFIRARCPESSEGCVEGCIGKIDHFIYQVKDEVFDELLVRLKEK